MTVHAGPLFPHDPSSMPLTVSVIVPTYNRAQFLSECLDSLLGQTLRPRQVIVVDDGSSDGTSDVLARYGRRIEVLRTASQGGKSGAVRLGLSHVGGDYVWILDDDDVAVPDALARCAEPLERDCAVAFSYGKKFYTGTAPDGRLGAVLFESELPDVRSRGLLAPLLEANFLGGAAIFGRTEAYRTVQGFNDAMVRSQDYDFAIRMARRFSGARVRGGALYHYRQHAGARGSARDRFVVEDQRRKWLHYDQVLFRRLRAELPLGEYLSLPRARTPSERQLLLQRASVMASKLLYDELVEDLKAIAELRDASPLDPIERRLVHRIFSHRPWYDLGSCWEVPRVIEAVRDAGRMSASGRLLRLHALAALARSCSVTALSPKAWGGLGPALSAMRVLSVP